MITAITTFRLPKPITRDEARRIFLSTAPKYQGVAVLSVKSMYSPKTGTQPVESISGTPEQKLTPCTPRVGKLS